MTRHCSLCRSTTHDRRTCKRLPNIAYFTDRRGIVHPIPDGPERLSGGHKRSQFYEAKVKAGRIGRKTYKTVVSGAPGASAKIVRVPKEGAREGVIVVGPNAGSTYASLRAKLGGRLRRFVSKDYS